MRQKMILLACTLVVAAGCSMPQSTKSGSEEPASPAVAETTMAGSATPSPTPSPSTAVSTAPALIKVPDVVGQNAAVAEDELKKLGFTNVELGTVDGHAFVVLAANWTVKKQSAKPGTKLASDAKIVLGCAKND